MANNKTESSVPSRHISAKQLVLIWTMAMILVVGGVIGGTLAWLLDSTETVTNTFTDSNIEITLTETDTDTDTEGEQHNYKMIPGWTIDKDPKVTVESGSEECWLFVEITESETPKLDDYITYEVQLDDPATTENVEGWCQGTEADGIPKNVYYRKVLKRDTNQEFSIIGYTDTKGTLDTEDDVFVEDKVLVNESVTSEMMEAITGEEKAKPTLTFQAFAVQLYKSNEPDDPATALIENEFTAAEAWTKAAAMKQNAGTDTGSGNQ